MIEVIVFIGGLVIGTGIFKGANAKTVRYGDMESRAFLTIKDWMFCVFVGMILSSMAVSVFVGAFWLIAVGAVILFIIAFFKGFFKKKKPAEDAVEGEEPNNQTETVSGNETSEEPFDK